MARLGWKRKGETVLLGLSGGHDSVTLLHLLLVNGHQVTAAHLNHHLRGKESNRDEQFVRKLCRTWKVPISVGHVDVAKHAQHYKLSTEEAARIARYRFLAQVARQRKIRKVLVGHHQQDQVETLLLKIFRGCSRHQLRGMEMIRSFPVLSWKKLHFHPKQTSLQLIRPLLEAPVSEIALYVQQNHLPFCEDSSNHDLSHPRNWIRHRLLPLLEQHLNRNVVKTLARMGKI